MRRYWISDSIHGLIGVLLISLFRLMPIDVASAAGAWAGRRLGPARGPAWDRRARENFARLRPDLDTPAKIDAAVTTMWGNIGRSMLEFACLERLYRGDRVRFFGSEHLQAARDSGRPRILLLLHLGNWELGFGLLPLLGEPFLQVYLPPRNRFEDKLAFRARKQIRTSMIAASPAAAMAAHSFLIKGRGSVMMAADDFVRGRVQAPFFGRPPCSDGNLGHAARLALMTDAVLLPVYVVRTGGVHFEHHITPAITPVRSGDRAADIAATVLLLDAAIEPIIRAHLDQWLMLHDLRFDQD